MFQVPKWVEAALNHQEYKDLKYFIWCGVLEKGNYLKSRSGVVLPRPWGGQKKKKQLYQYFQHHMFPFPNVKKEKFLPILYTS